MKKVFTYLREPSIWSSLLQEYFSEVEFEGLYEKDAAPQKANLIFLEVDCVQPALIQKIKVARSVNPQLRVFGLGECAKDISGIFDCLFESPGDLVEFSKKIAEKLPLPDSLRILIADDDADILSMVCDYFDGRSNPSFEVLRASNGREGLEWVEKKRPDAMILDVKMPLMSGSELYCKLQKQSAKIPTIIFYDAISAGDLKDIKKAGKPSIVEKGYRESSLPCLMATIKKLVFFSS